MTDPSKYDRRPAGSEPGNAPAPAVRTVKCPHCGGPSRYEAANRWRPFCSERCRMIDLGAWASDAYVVPGRAIESDDEAG